MSPLSFDTTGVLMACPSCTTTNRLKYEALDRTIQCGKCHTRLSAPSAPIEIHGTGLFDQLLAKATIPVVVDFWAPWCGPCHAMAPQLEQAARQLAGRALVVKVNTDVEQELGGRYRIQSIPTLAVFRNGGEVTRAAGARPAADIVALVTSVM